jgi:hypothetical protein
MPEPRDGSKIRGQAREQRDTGSGVMTGCYEDTSAGSRSSQRLASGGGTDRPAGRTLPDASKAGDARRPIRIAIDVPVTVPGLRTVRCGVGAFCPACGDRVRATDPNVQRDDVRWHLACTTLRLDAGAR